MRLWNQGMHTITGVKLARFTELPCQVPSCQLQLLEPRLPQVHQGIGALIGLERRFSTNRCNQFLHSYEVSGPARVGLALQTSQLVPNT